MLSTEYFLKGETLRPHITGSLILFCFRHTMTGMAWLLWKRLRRGNRYYPQTLVSPAKQVQLSLRRKHLAKRLPSGLQMARGSEYSNPIHTEILTGIKRRIARILSPPFKKRPGVAQLQFCTRYSVTPITRTHAFVFHVITKPSLQNWGWATCFI